MEGEFYHLYTRGVEKRTVFETVPDYERFMLLLLLCNREGGVSFRDIQQKYRGEPSDKVYELEASAKETVLAEIISYVLMPNHLHLVVREKEAGGISKLMLKLMTGYSMYFNTKYGRSGPLFTRPFRSRHVDSDEYFHWLFSYIHLNPLNIFQHDWKEQGLRDKAGASDFLAAYRYSSYPDYFSGEARSESHILARDTRLPFDVAQARKMDDLISSLAEHADAADTYQDGGTTRAEPAPALVY